MDTILRQLEMLKNACLSNEQRYNLIATLQLVIDGVLHQLYGNDKNKLQKSLDGRRDIGDIQSSKREGKNHGGCRKT